VNTTWSTLIHRTWSTYGHIIPHSYYLLFVFDFIAVYQPHSATIIYPSLSLLWNIWACHGFPGEIWDSLRMFEDVWGYGQKVWLCILNHFDSIATLCDIPWRLPYNATNYPSRWISHDFPPQLYPAKGFRSNSLFHQVAEVDNKSLIDENAANHGVNSDQLSFPQTPSRESEAVPPLPPPEHPPRSRVKVKLERAPGGGCGDAPMHAFDSKRASANPSSTSTPSKKAKVKAEPGPPWACRVLVWQMFGMVSDGLGMFGHVWACLGRCCFSRRKEH
jgi:hypothetical protein